MKCFSCGRPNSERDAYCRYCSEPLVAICANGHRSAPGAGGRFCPECRAPIKFQPRLPPTAIGCVARLLAWAISISFAVIAVRVIHHDPFGCALHVLAVFGVTQTDVERCVLWLVVIPGTLAFLSFALPDAMGQGFRRALAWVLLKILSLFWQFVRGLGRLVWRMAEGSDRARHPSNDDRRSTSSRKEI